VEYGRLKLDRTVGLWIEGPLRNRACRFCTSIRGSRSNQPNCRNLSIAIPPTNCWSQRPASFSVL
jgi:hypothetical protein